MEGNLNEAVLKVELADDTFADETVDPANIVLNNAPTGLTVEGVAYTDDTNIVIDLAFDGTDFDADITDFSVTINAAELEGAEDITTNALDIKTLSEINHFEKDGHVVSGAYSLDVVDIIGADFGDDKGNGYVKFYNNQNAEVIEWTDTKITCRISSTMRTGPVTVTRDDGVPSNSVSFIVTTQSKPSVPVGSSPTSLISTDIPVITWSSTASSGAVGYEMQVSLNSDTGFLNPVIDEEIMAATSYTSLSPLDRGKAYIWRVRAFNIYIGYSSWSTVKSFSIRQLPNITSIAPNPASGLSTSASNLVTITGTAFGSSRASTSFITFPNGLKVLSTDKVKVTVWSDTQIKVKVPPAAVTGDVTVTNSVGTSGPYALTIDSVAPSIESFMINSNDISTTSPTVSLSMEASDGGTGLAKMQFANSSSGPWSALEDFSSSKSGWILSSGPGIKDCILKSI